MVLVAVRQDDRNDVVEAVPDVAEVGQDQIDSGLLGLGEQHAAVDDQQLPVVLEDGHVATDLAETAEGHDAQGSGGQRRRRAEVRVRVAHPSTPAAMRSVRS